MITSDPRGQPLYEARYAWRKSSFCANGECVEVARRNGLILMRDSKEPGRCVLRYKGAAWRSFVRAIKAGDFGLA
jgi:hypothetical protein